MRQVRASKSDARSGGGGVLVLKFKTEFRLIMSNKENPLKVQVVLSTLSRHLSIFPDQFCRTIFRLSASAALNSWLLNCQGKPASTLNSSGQLRIVPLPLIRQIWALGAMNLKR